MSSSTVTQQRSRSIVPSPTLSSGLQQQVYSVVGLLGGTALPQPTCGGVVICLSGCFPSTTCLFSTWSSLHTLALTTSSIGRFSSVSWVLWSCAWSSSLSVSTSCTLW